MSESFLNDRVTLHCGDCTQILPTLAENSIDSVCCDPPYHLTSIVKRFGGEDRKKWETNGQGGGTASPYQRTSVGFMGKQWDGGDIAFRPELWAQVYRVLKPGAHLLAFGGTRTYHRMACAIEDAGFEIRDTCGYLFGSGFPKSHSIGKKLDESEARCSCDSVRNVWESGAPPAVTSKKNDGDILQLLMSEQDFRGSPTTICEQWPGQETTGEGAARRTQSSLERRGNVSETPRQLREREIRPMSATTSINGSGGRVRDGASPSDGDMDQTTTDPGGMCSSPRPSAVEQCTDESGTMAMQSQPQERRAWDHCGRCGKPIIPDGFGTALKPAMELIVLARKPLSEGTVAANVLRWGTGAINVDGCRVATDDTVTTHSKGNCESYGKRPGETTVAESGRTTPQNRPEFIGNARNARWPANVIHDGSEEVVGAFPDAPGQQYATGPQYERNANVYGTFTGVTPAEPRGDSGSAARFFYTSKADADDRLGSKHPTVKPLDLMQYLVRLITPKGGTVLDPFAGTGTTGEAAFREGMRAVLIEREEEYCADIRRRMQLVMSGPDERAREAIKQRMKDKPVDHGPLFNHQYDADRDFSESIDECYRDIRERVAKGGPGWGGWPE